MWGAGRTQSCSLTPSGTPPASRRAGWAQPVRAPAAPVAPRHRRPRLRRAPAVCPLPAARALAPDRQLHRGPFLQSQKKALGRAGQHWGGASALLFRPVARRPCPGARTGRGEPRPPPPDAGGSDAEPRRRCRPAPPWPWRGQPSPLPSSPRRRRWRPGRLSGRGCAERAACVACPGVSNLNFV
jgi:hypothetical protein